MLASTISENGSLFTMQMYWGNPKSWTPRQFSAEDLSWVRDHCMTYDKNFYVHASCLIHLGKAKTNQGPTLAYLKSILNQLENIPGSLIVHIGKSSTTSLELISDMLSQVYIPESTGI